MKKIKTIKLSLLKKITDIQESGKADYLKKKTAKFVLPEKFSKYSYESLITEMYNDVNDNNIEADSIGLWIEYDDGKIIENAISIRTLEDIKKYSTVDINPAYEFFKMSINQQK